MCKWGWYFQAERAGPSALPFLCIYFSPFPFSPPFTCVAGLADEIWLSASAGPRHRTAADTGGADKSHHGHAAVRGTGSHGGARSVGARPFCPRCGRGGGIGAAVQLGCSPCLTDGRVCSWKSNYMAQVLCCLVLSTT